MGRRLFKLSELRVEGDGRISTGHPAHSAVPEPPKQLEGFAKVQLAPGRTKHVTLGLAPQSFAYWRTATNNWTVQPGTYTVSVGTSSRDLPLAAHVKIGG